MTQRQAECLIALGELEVEDTCRSSQIYGWTAEAIARKAGFKQGPRHHGNGAKDGRSWSGWGSPAKYVTRSLHSLDRAGLVELLDLHEGRSWRFQLTDKGREALAGVKE